MKRKNNNYRSKKLNSDIKNIIENCKEKCMKCQID